MSAPSAALLPKPELPKELFTLAVRLSPSAHAAPAPPPASAAAGQPAQDPSCSPAILQRRRPLWARGPRPPHCLPAKPGGQRTPTHPAPGAASPHVSAGASSPAERAAQTSLCLVVHPTATRHSLCPPVLPPRPGLVTCNHTSPAPSRPASSVTPPVPKGHPEGPMWSPQACALSHLRFIRLCEVSLSSGGFLPGGDGIYLGRARPGAPAGGGRVGSSRSFSGT